VSDPRTGPEIRAALRDLHAASVRYWGGFDTAAFLAPVGDAWSPADNVRHLTKSMRAVTRGLGVPRLLLLLAFRRGQTRSRPYDAVREVYRARLAQGASAGRFAPEARPAPPDPDAERARIMAYHATAVEALCAATERWPEPALDRRRLPHPLLGPLTVREMLFFTLYHNQHHVDNVRRRIAAIDPTHGA
jgi:DinB superfamily